MAITTVNTKSTLTKKIELLNDMIKEVNGKVEQGKFDINEILQLITDLSLDREYLRNQLLGNTTSNYTDWSHLRTESGYSIWKLTPTAYSYSVVNQLYFDDIILDNRGQATAESSTSFDIVYLFNGDSGSGFTDNTTEAGSESGTEFEVMDSTNDYLYVGATATFTGINFEFHTRGSGNTLSFEYYSDESGVNDWVVLTANDDTLVDNTSNFESNGLVTFDAPTNWGATTVNSQNKFWIRVSSTATPTTAAKIYSVIPGESVIALLGMSSTQIQNEDWAWTSFSGSVYVTIRNEGNSTYEGDAFIKSGSSVANLQNFFVHNHTYKADYLDSSYSQTIYDLDNISSSESLISVTISSGVSFSTGDIASIDSAGEAILADALDNTKVAAGIVSAVGSTTVDIKNSGTIAVNTVGLGDILAGDRVYLSTSESGVTEAKINKSPATGDGNIVQLIGLASANESASQVTVFLGIDYAPLLF